MADTTQAVFQTVIAVMCNHGYTREEIGDLHRFLGPPLVDAFRDAYRLGDDEARAYTAEYREIFEGLTAADYPVYPGVAALLDDLVAAGRRVAVASSRVESKARGMIAELGLDQFEVVFGRNAAAGRATKADAIRDALEALGADAAGAVMVGDSHFDMEGAAAFGLPAIGVTYGGTSEPEALAAAGAVAVCRRVEDLRHVLGI